MKNSKLVIATGTLGGLIACNSADATLVGLVLALESSGGGPPPSGNPRWIIHAYAHFTTPADRVNAWGAGSSLGPGGIQNVLLNGITPGSGFTNIGGGGGEL